MDIEIEKGVPITPPRGRRKYPLADMDVGDSFLVPVADPASARKLQVSVGGAGRSPKYRGKRFATRKVDGGVRVWRIE